MSPFRASVQLSDSWKNSDFEVRDDVATVTFNRPEKLNAPTFDAYADLRDLLAELGHRVDAKVLAITGRGRGFCSGGDVEEIIGERLKLAADESPITHELDTALGNAIELEAITQAPRKNSDDFAEFYAARGEGRKPAWKGR
jgi:1,4-dihydroxy-2-naphthoyl-CoA synthase